MKKAARLKKDTVVRLLLAGEMGGGNVLQDEPMSKHSSFRVGGNADWMLRANDAEELIKAVYVARRTKLPYRIIGAGSNILVADEGFRGVVIVNRSNHYELIEHQHGFVLTVESGASLPRLAGELAKRGAAGFEWCVGVPGTIGGAVVQNAGAWGSEIKDRLLSIEFVTPGTDSVSTMPASKLELRYRGSLILDTPPEERPVVVRAWFRLDRDDPAAIAQRNAANIAERTATQPRAASGGSTFRNPDGDYAGRLIEAAGLKGHRIGGASFSEQHANFIVNHGGGTAANICALIELAQATVEEKFGIRLHPEIEFVGFDHPASEDPSDRSGEVVVRSTEGRDTAERNRS